MFHELKNLTTPQVQTDDLSFRSHGKFSEVSEKPGKGQGK